jgi:putative glycosyl hydrolase
VRRTAGVIVALVACAAAASAQHRLAGSPAGDPAVVKPRFPFGVVAFDLNGASPAALSRLGTGLIRGSCAWGSLEPARGVFNWSCADDVIMGAKGLRLRSYMTIVCTPDWANGGRGCARMPTDITDWYSFVANFVSRYQKFDTILGVWNEPNFDSSLEDTAGGQNYALLFINASNARNTVSATFPIAGPETSHHALASGYFRGTMNLIEAFGALDDQDIIGVHWYPDGPPLTGYLDAIHAAVGGRDVWLSETGIATADFTRQADFLNRMLQAFEAGGRPWWTHIIFYRLWDGSDCCTESILRADYTPKPAYDVYRDWILKPHAVPRPPGGN